MNLMDAVRAGHEEYGTRPMTEEEYDLWLAEGQGSGQGEEEEGA